MHATRISRQPVTLTAILTCAAVMLAAVCSAVAAPRQALEQVPQDADAVLVVPNLAALSGKIANLRQALNLPMPELDDTLGAFKQATGMTAGVNDDGALLVVLPDLAQAIQEDREPAALLLVPVTDYQAFVGNFGGDANEAVTALTMPGAQASFGRQVGGYAVLAQAREHVEGYQAGNAADAVIASVGALGGRYLDSSDAVLYLNVQKMAPTLLPLIDEAIGQMTQQFRQMSEMGMMAPDAVAQLEVIYSLYGAAAKAVVRDGTGLVVGLDLSDDGIGLSKSIGYRAGSDLARLFPAGAARPTGLANLPEQPFIYAVAADTQAIALTPLYERVAAAMPAGAGAWMPDPAMWLPLIQNLKGFAAAFYAPDDLAIMSGNVMNTLTVLDVENPQQYVASLKNYVTQMNDMEIPVAAPGADGQPMTMSYATSYTDNALRLQGVQVDQFQVSTNLPPQMMQQLGPAAGFAQMFMNYGGYVAAKDDKVLATTVIDPQLVTRGFQAITDGDGIGSAGALSRVRDAGLPPNLVAEAYLSLSGIARTANVFMGMFGMPPIEAPADLAPLAMGLAREENSAAFRLYLPVETIKFAIETGMGLAGPMMGAPGGAPGPGGPPPF